MTYARYGAGQTRRFGSAACAKGKKKGGGRERSAPADCGRSGRRCLLQVRLPAGLMEERGELLESNRVGAARRSMLIVIASKGRRAWAIARFRPIPKGGCAFRLKRAVEYVEAQARKKKKVDFRRRSAGRHPHGGEERSCAASRRRLRRRILGRNRCAGKKGGGRRDVGSKPKSPVSSGQTLHGAAAASRKGEQAGCEGLMFNKLQ